MIQNASLETHCPCQARRGDRHDGFVSDILIPEAIDCGMHIGTCRWILLDIRKYRSFDGTLTNHVEDASDVGLRPSKHVEIVSTSSRMFRQ